MNTPTSINLTVLSVLKAGQWFQGLDSAILEQLASLSVIRTFAANETIFRRGDQGKNIYGIITGQLRVTTTSVDGRELALNTMGAGDIGGEIAALDGGLRTATWTALEPMTVFTIDRQSLLDLMAERRDFAQHMINVLCQRVRDTSRQVEDAAFLTVAERLARLLIQMVNDTEQNLPCRIHISQRELASFISASRQVVNGCLQTWQKSGLLDVGRGYINVIDPAAMLSTAARE